MTIFTKRTESVIFLTLAMIVGSLTWLSFPRINSKKLEQKMSLKPQYEVVRLPPVQQSPEFDIYKGLKELVTEPRELPFSWLPPSRQIPKIFPNSRYEFFTGWDLLSKPEDHIYVVDSYPKERPKARTRARIINIRPIKEPRLLPYNHGKNAVPLPLNRK